MNWFAEKQRLVNEGYYSIPAHTLDQSFVWWAIFIIFLWTTQYKYHGYLIIDLVLQHASATILLKYAENILLDCVY